RELPGPSSIPFAGHRHSGGGVPSGRRVHRCDDGQGRGAVRDVRRVAVRPVSCADDCRVRPGARALRERHVGPRAPAGGRRRSVRSEAPVRHALEYSAVVFVRALARLLPDWVVRLWGDALGLTFYLVDRSHRRVALGNLAECFPTRSARERRAMARRTFRHFGRLLLELLRFSALPDRRRNRLVEIEGADHVRRAYAQGKGVLFFTGHFGFWELHAIQHGAAFEPIGVLARALATPRLDALLEQIRGGTGNSCIYRQGAVRRVLKALAANHGVALLIDQHMHSPDAIWVSFFRRPAATTSTLAALA